jgi:hypothetical protein
MKAHQKCYILAPFTLMDNDISLPQLPALCAKPSTKQDSHKTERNAGKMGTTILGWKLLRNYTNWGAIHQF